MHQTPSLVGSEEKSAILLNGAAKSSAELILLEVRFFKVEETPSVKHFVPEECIHATVQLVGAGFGDDVDHCAGITPVLGIKCVSQNTEFLDAVGGWLNLGQVGELVVAIATVHAVVIRSSPASVHRHYTCAVA